MIHVMILYYDRILFDLFGDPFHGYSWSNPGVLDAFHRCLLVWHPKTEGLSCSAVSRVSAAPLLQVTSSGAFSHIEPCKPLSSICREETQNFAGAAAWAANFGRPKSSTRTLFPSWISIHELWTSDKILFVPERQEILKLKGFTNQKHWTNFFYRLASEIAQDRNINHCGGGTCQPFRHLYRQRSRLGKLHGSNHLHLLEASAVGTSKTQLFGHFWVAFFELCPKMVMFFQHPKCRSRSDDSDHEIRIYYNVLQAIIIANA